MSGEACCSNYVLDTRSTCPRRAAVTSIPQASCFASSDAGGPDADAGEAGAPRPGGCNGGRLALCNDEIDCQDDRTCQSVELALPDGSTTTIMACVPR